MFKLSCGKCDKYRLLKFFVFVCGSLPYLLSLFFWSGVTVPLVALDKIATRALEIPIREIQLSSFVCALGQCKVTVADRRRY